jgi:hypothetical protein
LRGSGDVVGINAAGIIRDNTVTAGGYSGASTIGAGTGISATGVISGNFVAGMTYGILAAPGSTLVNNASDGNSSIGIRTDCPVNLIGNVAIDNNPDLQTNGTGCLNNNNLTP